MKTFVRFLVAIVAITGAVALSTGFLGIEFGYADYWERHGLLFLLCLAVFPRLTLLLGGMWTGGLLWWVGWLFAPRLLVAVLATLAYWHNNPFLVIVSWLVALGGESSEKYVMVKRPAGAARAARRGYESAKWVRSE